MSSKHLFQEGLLYLAHSASSVDGVNHIAEKRALKRIIEHEKIPEDLYSNLLVKLPQVSLESMELMSAILLYVVNHLIVTLLRAYSRFKKLSNYYESVGRKEGAYSRAIYKRILKSSTFFYALLLTLAQYLFFNLFRN